MIWDKLCIAERRPILKAYDDDDDGNAGGDDDDYGDDADDDQGVVWVTRGSSAVDSCLSPVICKHLTHHYH